MPTDKLQVDLSVINGQRAVNDVQQFTRSLTAAEVQANKTGAAFSTSLAAAQRQALSLDQTLRTIQQTQTTRRVDDLFGAGVSGLGKAAVQAQKQVQGLYKDLRSLESLAAVSRDPHVLRGLEIEIARTSKELDALERKIQRVAAGRQARAAGSGSGGLTSGLLTAGAFGLPFATEAGFALEGASALGINTGVAGAAAASALPIAAAGAVLIKITHDIRTEAERRLKIEEAISIEYGKQQKALQDQQKNFREADALRERQARFQSQLADTTQLDALQRQLANQRRIRTLNGFNVNEADQNVQAIEARIRQVQEQRTAAADAAFAENFKNFQDRERQAAEAERERRARRIESIQKAQVEVENLADTADKLFADLAGLQGASNPFSKVFSQAATLIERVRTETAALRPELQAIALEAARAVNANDLFAARLDARLNAADLRTQAADIRNRAGRSFADQNARAAFDRIQREESRSIFDNPAFFESQRRLVELQLQLDRSRTTEPLSASERLERLVREIRDLTPANEAQRELIDRKIIALTQGIDPAEFSDNVRNEAIAARERQAEQIEKAERAAAGQRDEQVRVQKSIDANIGALLKIAQSEGLTGVIRIVNEAEDTARDSIGRRRRARDQDAADFMRP